MKNKNLKYTLLAATAALNLACAPLTLQAAEDSELTISSGFDFSDGKYSDRINTKILYLPLSLKYVTGPWTMRATTGYVSIEGPGTIIPGSNGPVIPTRRPTDDTLQSRKTDGIGDISLGLSYAVESLYDDDIFIDFTGRVKIPTADADKGLGTGKADFTLQIDAARLIGDFMPFATLGYRIMGKSDLFQLQNSWFASIGAAYYFTSVTSFGLSYDYRKSTSLNAEDPREIMAYLDMQVTEKWGINLYGIAGLSESSPDYGIGLQLRMKLF